MKLIKDLILKKIQYYDEYWNKRFYIRAIWQFYQALCWSIIVLDGFNKRKLLSRQKFYRKIFPTSFKVSLSDYDFRKVDRFIKEDKILIMKAIDRINELNENGSVYFGSYYKTGTIGISMEEYPEE